MVEISSSGPKRQVFTRRMGSTEGWGNATRQCPDITGVDCLGRTDVPTRVVIVIIILIRGRAEERPQSPGRGGLMVLSASCIIILNLC